MCVGGKYSYNVRIFLKITRIDHFTIRLYSIVQEGKAINHLEIYVETLNVNMTKEIHENPKYIEEILFMFRKYTMKSADELIVGTTAYKETQAEDWESTLAVQGDLNWLVFITK